nr:hypothetical protein KPHV_06300 [Kitasatospora purpeofusca]
MVQTTEAPDMAVTSWSDGAGQQTPARGPDEGEEGSTSGPRQRCFDAPASDLSAPGDHPEMSSSTTMSGLLGEVVRGRTTEKINVPGRLTAGIVGRHPISGARAARDSTGT